MTTNGRLASIYNDNTQVCVTLQNGQLTPHTSLLQ